MHQRTCPHCGGEFAATRSDKRFCSKQCRSYYSQVKLGGAEYLREVQRRSRQNHKKPCVECGEPTNGERCRSCSATVASLAKMQAAEDQRNDPARKALVVRPMSGVAPAVPVTVVDGPRNWAWITNGPCSWCGSWFTSTGWKAMYCSVRCSSRAAKRRRGEFLISPLSRMAIYDRDGWACQLCGSPVDHEADYLDPWAPTLDHIVPRSHQLVPDDSADNLRTAHRWCNAVRGNHGLHDDLFDS